MTKPQLLVLAAGMGSRFGGLKQLSPVGPNQEAILEYSVFDAARSGFEKVVFVIRKSFEEAFKDKFDAAFRKHLDVDYVFQEIDYLPEGFSVPDGREKPWGTGHAILMAKNAITAPFAVINADDFYGAPAFQAMADFLTNRANASTYSMIAYALKNTLSPQGSVSRGVCKTDEKKNLIEIIERTNIQQKGTGIFYSESGEDYALAPETTVSMNFWGFSPTLFKDLESLFIQFLKQGGSELKSEFYIPFAVFDLIAQNKVNVEVIEADSPWFGVTYQEDMPAVKEGIANLVRQGIYPEKLW